MAQMVRTHSVLHTSSRFESLRSLYVYKYVDKKGSAATLAMKQLACITPGVNLRNPLCAGKEACQ